MDSKEWRDWIEPLKVSQASKHNTAKIFAISIIEKLSRWLELETEVWVIRLKCLLWIHEPIRSDRNQRNNISKKWDILIQSENGNIYGIVKLDGEKPNKRISSIICHTWAIGKKWILDFLNKAVSDFWVSENCPNYIAIVKYFHKLQDA